MLTVLGQFYDKSPATSEFKDTAMTPREEDRVMLHVDVEGRPACHMEGTACLFC